MPWFLVDDTLATHPKARKAGLAAMGLWAVAGAYAAQHLTEGHVPDWYVNSWPNGRKLAKHLVDAKLWVLAEDGWVFHQWDERPQAKKSSVEAKRAANRERQKRFRDRAHETTPRNAKSNAVNNAPVTALVTPPHALPNQERTNSPTSTGLRNVPAGTVPRIIRAYVEACPEPPAEELQSKIERSARSLLRQGFTEADVVEAARSAGRSGWTDLATQMQRDAARSSPNNAPKSTADARFHEAAALADRLDQKAIQS